MIALLPSLPRQRLSRRVRRLEEAVRENALLAAPLERRVTHLEQSLVPLLEAAVARSSRRRRPAPAAQPANAERGARG